MPHLSERNRDQNKALLIKGRVCSEFTGQLDGYLSFFLVLCSFCTLDCVGKKRVTCSGKENHGQIENCTNHEGHAFLFLYIL